MPRPDRLRNTTTARDTACPSPSRAGDLPSPRQGLRVTASSALVDIVLRQARRFLSPHCGMARAAEFGTLGKMRIYQVKGQPSSVSRRRAASLSTCFRPPNLPVSSMPRCAKAVGNGNQDLGRRGEELKRDAIRVAEGQPGPIGGIDNAVMGNAELIEPIRPLLELVSIGAVEGQMMQAHAALVERQVVSRVGELVQANEGRTPYQPDHVSKWARVLVEDRLGGEQVLVPRDAAVEIADREHDRGDSREIGRVGLLVQRGKRYRTHSPIARKAMRTRAVQPLANIWRSSRFRTLPAALRGSASTILTTRGTL